MARQGHKKKKKTKNSLWSKAPALITAAGFALVLVVVALWTGLGFHTGEPRWIYVPAGATSEAVGDSLRSALGSSMANRVLLLWRLQGGTPSMAHGAYLVNTGRTALSLSRALKTGRQTPVRVSFNGARTLDRIYNDIAANLELSPQEVARACDSVLPTMGFKSRAMYPAAFLPDTYEFYWTVDAADLVKRLADYRNDFWTPERRDRARALGLDPVAVATIASIVEEETAKRDERPMVARLYINRLDKGMKLQADPTVKFATGNFALRRITSEHLRTPSPYNTYLHAGLPPGPIRIVERATLEDVLNAPRHDYIYMCAKSDFSGYHDFASDYATHQVNARRYQAELNRRGIK